MAHYAKIKDSIVLEVIVADHSVIDSFEDPTEWIQTSYNTHGGVHSEGNTPLRKNYAGIGFTYDSVRDAFIPPQPYNSWTLNEDTCQWESPVPYPTDDKRYNWDEDTTSWVETVEE